MTQTPSGQDQVQQFDRLEQDLENWRDQLAQLSPYLSPSELAKMARRWDLMRQNLDGVFLNYGRPLFNLPIAMDSLPPLRDLNQEELDITVDALVTAKKTLDGLIAESQQRVPLLEQALNIDQKPARLRRCLDKMRAIDDSFQVRLQSLVTYVEQFNLTMTQADTLAQTTQKVIDQTIRIEALKKANSVLEEQKQEMARWLAESKRRLLKIPLMPPPTPNALGLVGQSLAPRTDANKALEKLFANRDKLRDARRYLEAFLAEKENS